MNLKQQQTPPKKGFFGFGSSITQKIGGIFSKKEPKKTQSEAIETAASSAYEPSQTEPTTNKRQFNIILSDDGDKDQDIYTFNNDEDEELEEDDEYSDEKEEEPGSETNNDINKAKDIPKENKAEEFEDTKDKKQGIVNESQSNINTESENNKSDKTVLKDDNISDSTLNNKNDNSNSIQSTTTHSTTKPISTKKIFCHRLRRKGTIIDLSETTYFTWVKLKESNNIFTKLKFMDSSLIEKPYIIFIEERFMYFAKNNEINKTNKMLRRIGNKISLFDIRNIYWEADNSYYILILELEVLNKTKVKHYRIHSRHVEDFIGAIDLKLKSLGININTDSTPESQI